MSDQLSLNAFDWMPIEMGRKSGKAGAPKSVPRRAAYPVRETGVLLGGAGSSTVRRWMSQGLIEGVRVGGRVLVPQSEIDRLTTQGRAA